MKKKDHIITLSSLETCPVEYNLILSYKRGVGYARNSGAKQSEKRDELLVFFDDDLILDEHIWEDILSTETGQFKMLVIGKGRYAHPCSRIMCIWGHDFWSINGFDEKFYFTAEDVDFYLRAIGHGLNFIPISERFVKHVEHKKSRRRVHLERGRLLVKHGLIYIKYYGGIIRYLLHWIKKPRTHFLTLIGFFYYLFVGVD